VHGSASLATRSVSEPASGSSQVESFQKTGSFKPRRPPEQVLASPRLSARRAHHGLRPETTRRRWPGRAAVPVPCVWSCRGRSRTKLEAVRATAPSNCMRTGRPSSTGLTRARGPGLTFVASLDIRSCSPAPARRGSRSRGSAQVERWWCRGRGGLLWRVACADQGACGQTSVIAGGSWKRAGLRPRWTRASPFP